MKLNTKVRYGIRTMIQIGLDNEKGILQKDISKKQDISYKYLDHIIAPLKAKGLIYKDTKKKSYVLKKQAKDIRIYEIYTAFEEELKLAPCINENDEICTKKSICAAEKFWSGLNTLVKDYFESQTLQDLINNQIDFA